MLNASGDELERVVTDAVGLAVQRGTLLEVPSGTVEKRYLLNTELCALRWFGKVLNYRNHLQPASHRGQRHNRESRVLNYTQVSSVCMKKTSALCRR